MKKAISSIVISVALLCSILTGCNTNSNTDAQSTGLSAEEIQMINEATNAHDISAFLTKTADFMKYSECDNDSGLDMYFDLLATESNKYYITKHDGEKYLLFYCVYSAYGEEMTAITDISKEYNADKLTVTISKEIKSIEQSGCEPDLSYTRCILRLENDITSLSVDGKDYFEYSGGYIRAADLWGVVDKDLNVIVPIQYDIIREFDEYRSDDIYYYMTTENGMGLMDAEFQTVLPPIYNNIYYANGDRFIVSKGPRNEIKHGEWQIGIVDRNGDLLHEYINGYLNGYESFNNTIGQAVLSRTEGDACSEGVIDEELNIIIEPIYKDVRYFDIGAENIRFYVVENQNSEFAVFDSSGKQQTEFEKTSVYEAQTRYRETLQGEADSF